MVEEPMYEEKLETITRESATPTIIKIKLQKNMFPCKENMKN